MAKDKDLNVGTKVSWQGGDAHGRIAKVATSGSVSSSAGGDKGITMDASEDNPAYKIDVFRKKDGEWSITDDTVVHRAGNLTVISDWPS